MRFWFWVCQGSGYTRVIQGSGCAWIILKYPEYSWVCLNMPEHAGICVDMPKSAWMTFVLHLPVVIPCLKEPEAVFLKKQNLYFSIAAECIWFVFYFRLIIFTRKISNLLLSLGAEDLDCWYTQCIYQWCLFNNLFIYFCCCC